MLTRSRFAHSVILKFIQGTVRVDAFVKPVLIPGRQNMNRAMHGDIVAVEMFPQEDWRSAGEAVVDQDGS